jgi:hypothetical protein
MSGGRRVIIVGATSAIARTTARLFADEGASQVVCFEFEATVWPRFDALFNAVERHLGSPEIVLVAHGTLPDQMVCETDLAAMRMAFEVNGLATMTLLMLLAARLERQGHGTLAVISSVAGDRGRRSNYVYGASKAGLNTFLQGLRARLGPAGVNVLTVKPGFVDTPMTDAFEKGLLWVQPDTVARGIHGAIAKGRSEIYLPGFWRWIMLVLRLLPERIFMRLPL